VRLTPRAAEIFLKGERIAAHMRAGGNHRHTNCVRAQPACHRRYADWKVERIRHEATSIRPATAALCELILKRRPRAMRPIALSRKNALFAGSDGTRKTGRCWPR
jgi:hypothetical protein